MGNDTKSSWNLGIFDLQIRKLFVKPDDIILSGEISIDLREVSIDFRIQ
jgi:hypothetical protein